jgi:hypothetical protein
LSVKEINKNKNEFLLYWNFVYSSTLSYLLLDLLTVLPGTAFQTIFPQQFFLESILLSGCLGKLIREKFSGEELFRV